MVDMIARIHQSCRIIPPVRKLVAVALFTLAFATLLHAQSDPSFYGEMRWRSIGPFRGGRTVAAAGVPTQPHGFYMGVNNGGGWENTHNTGGSDPPFSEPPRGAPRAPPPAPPAPPTRYTRTARG